MAATGRAGVHIRKWTNEWVVVPDMIVGGNTCSLFRDSELNEKQSMREQEEKEERGKRYPDSFVLLSCAV